MKTGARTSIPHCSYPLIHPYCLPDPAFHIFEDLIWLQMEIQSLEIPNPFYIMAEHNDVIIF